MAEYAVILAGIAVVCIVAAVFLGAAIEGRYESGDAPMPEGPFTPPPGRAPPQLNYPATREECEDGGWRDFPQFRDEAECKRYVASLGP